MLQSSGLEDRMKTICNDQSIFISSYFEQKCMNNIENIYQHAGNCDDQKKLKDILYSSMVSTPEVVTYNNPNLPITSTSVNKLS